MLRGVIFGVTGIQRGARLTKVLQLENETLPQVENLGRPFTRVDQDIGPRAKVRVFGNAVTNAVFQS